MEEQVPSLTCLVGEEPECKDITAKLQYVKVGDCLSEEQVDIHYCQVRGPRLGGASSLFGHVSLVAESKHLGNSQGGEVKGTGSF